MPDPDTVAIPVLAGAALAQGITFLYGQAAEVLRIRREGKAAQRTTLTVPAAFEPLGFAVTPDLGILEARAGELATLFGMTGILAARAADEIDGADPLLRTCFGGVRDVLEEVYGARFTFIGEDRPARRVQQSVDDVKAPTTGMKLRGARAATVGGEVVQRVGTVHRGAELTGMEIDLRD